MSEANPDPNSTNEIGDLLSGLIIEDASPEDLGEQPAPRRTRKTTGESIRDALRTPTRPKVEKPKERIAPHKKDEFIEPLTKMYASVGLLVMAFDAPCGGTVLRQAPACAQSLDDLAAKDPNVRKALRTLTTGSSWAGVIAAHAPIMLAIASHHMPGALPPSVASAFVAPDDDLNNGAV